MAMMGRLDRVAERLKTLTVAEDIAGPALSQAAQPLADWAAIARSWRDHYVSIAAEHHRLNGVGRARTPADWVRREQLIAVHAKLITTEFAQEVFDLLAGMADYLEHRACATHCPDHATWASEIRGWSEVYVGVLELHGDGVAPGMISAFEPLLSHPSYRATVDETLTAELAAGMASRLGGLAEFFQAESRRLAAFS